MQETAPASAPHVPADAAEAFIARHDPDWPEYCSVLRDYYSAPQHIQKYKTIQTRWDDAEYTAKTLKASSRAERSAVLRAIAGNDPRGVWNGEPTAENALARCLSCLLMGLSDPDIEFDTSPEVFGAIAQIAGTHAHWDSRVFPIKDWLPRMAAIHALGHKPTDAERHWLRQLRGKLEPAMNRRIGKEDQRQIAAMIQWIDTAIGATDAERLARLVAPVQPQGWLPPAPENFEFWVRFIKDAAVQVAVLASEVNGKSQPDWVRDEDAYAKRFPLLAGSASDFSFWREEQLRGQSIDNIPTRARYGRIRDAATARIYDDALTAARDLATLDLVWSSNAVPEAARLADPADPAQASLLLHLAASKPGPKPPAAWLTRAKALSAAIGHERCRDRMVDWLTQFAAVVPTEDTQMRLWNHWIVVSGATRLQESRPELALADRRTRDQAVVTMALRAAARPSGYPHAPPDDPYLQYDEWRRGWLYGLRNGKTASQASRRDYSEQLIPSLSNEAVLRGVCWLLGEFDSPAVVDVLEKTVEGAVAFGDCYGTRTRGTANAAIASLARIGTRPALVALGRVRRTVKDKAVANSIAKAIAGLAAKLGAAPEEVEEMGVPDYGFA